MSKEYSAKVASLESELTRLQLVNDTQAEEAAKQREEIEKLRQSNDEYSQQLQVQSGPISNGSND